MTISRQPWLHGPDLYDRASAGLDGTVAPHSGGGQQWPQDPETVAEAPTLAARIDASGVAGETEADRREAYTAYLAMLGSSVAQLAAGTMHGYLNKHSLVVAAGPDGPLFRLPGDRTLLAVGAGALRAAEAAATSRRAISELLRDGETDVTTQEIVAGFPGYVEQDGRLITLREWHSTGLRELCVQELFGRWHTQATRVFLSAASRRLGVPSADLEALRTGASEEPVTPPS